VRKKEKGGSLRGSVRTGKKRSILHLKNQQVHLRDRRRDFRGFLRRKKKATFLNWVLSRQNSNHSSQFEARKRMEEGISKKDRIAGKRGKLKVSRSHLAREGKERMWGAISLEKAKRRKERGAKLYLYSKLKKGKGDEDELSSLNSEGEKKEGFSTLHLSARDSQQWYVEEDRRKGRKSRIEFAKLFLWRRKRKKRKEKSAPINRGGKNFSICSRSATTEKGNKEGLYAGRGRKEEKS